MTNKNEKDKSQSKDKKTEDRTETEEQDTRFGELPPGSGAWPGGASDTRES